MNRNIAVLLTAFLISCNSSERRMEAFLPEPIIAGNKKLYPIPVILKEISGICFINEHELVAVQDEAGVLYFYDIRTQEVTRQLTFGEEGDYEDVAVSDRTIYVVASDGSIIQIDDFLAQPIKPRQYKTPLTEKNNIEGLAFDGKNNRLLLVTKDRGLTNNEEKSIYAFDLKTGQLDTTPVFTIELEAIEAFFKGDKLEEASKNFLKALGNRKLNGVFRPSAIALHPTTGEVFVLTSLNNMIAVLSPQNGKITRIIELKGSDFNQPEGLAFTLDGRLFVSNESNGERANIIEITYD